METSDSPTPNSPPSGAADAVGVLLLQQAAEVAALRARLREVEAALDLPTRPGRPAPSTLPALLHRVAVLERHAALAPELLPPPEDRPAATSTPAAASQTTTRASWRDWGQALAGVAIALALLAWLVYPAQPGTRTPPAAAVPPTAVATSAAAPAGAPAFRQGYAAPGPFALREDHQQPSPTTDAPATMAAGAMDCPLTMVGSCYGQWTAYSCADDMSQDELDTLGVCFGELPAPLLAP